MKKTLPIIFIILFYSAALFALEDFYSYVHEMDDLICNDHSDCHSFSDCFLIVLVDAHHLDYRNIKGLLRSLVKHRTNGSKNGDIGHAWIYLSGKIKGKRVVIEGGHTGQSGIEQPTYYEVLSRQRFPTLISFDPKNPISYLSCDLEDGYFQNKSGNHYPTFAAAFDLTEEQFFRLLNLIHPSNYPYKNYSLSSHHCCTFVKTVLASIDLALNERIALKIDSKIHFSGKRFHLWQDPIYSLLNFETPDTLEKELVRLVQEKKAKIALKWYLKQIS